VNAIDAARPHCFTGGSRKLRYASNSGAALRFGPTANKRAEFFNVPRLCVVGWPFRQVRTVRVAGLRETKPVRRHDVGKLAVDRFPGAVDGIQGAENVDQFRAVEGSNLNRV
jgi:hypothetical protein